MSGLFDGTKWERPVTCESCGAARDACRCPRNAAGEVTRPQDQQVRVQREKRRSGKVVTVVRGLDPQASDLNDLLGQLKSMCAAGGTVSDAAIEVQGDHCDRVIAKMIELGYPAKRSGG